MLDPTIGGARNNTSGFQETKRLQMGVTQQCRSELKLGPRLSRPQSRALRSPTHHMHTLGVSGPEAVQIPRQRKIPSTHSMFYHA